MAKPREESIKSPGTAQGLYVKDLYVKEGRGAEREQAGCISISKGIVHFLLPGFPATPPRNHNHPQLGVSTPADGAVKDLLQLGYIGPHGGLVGA